MFADAALELTRFECSQAVHASAGTSVSGLGNVGQLERGWEQVIRDLTSLYQLSDDWDGCGAAAPEGQVIRSAVELANLLRAKLHPLPDRALATPAGTILFDWHDASGYRECEVFSPDDVAFTARDNAGNYYHDKVKLPPFGYGNIPIV